MGIAPKEIQDMEIYHIIELLNRFEYVQTIFCCSGHDLWQYKTNNDPPYVEYKFKDDRGIKLANHIVSKLKKDFVGKMAPRVDVYEDNSLKIRGTYVGSWEVDAKVIQKIVMDFWKSWELAILDFMAKNK